MITNRSVPTNAILPHVIYRDVSGAIVWLTKVFGFSEHYRYGSPADPSGAQLHLADAYLMIERARDRSTPAQIGHSTQYLTVFVEDIEAHYVRTKAAEARMVEELHETEYGELQYAVEDLDGHRWIFSRHARDLGPEQWGATLAAG